MLKTPLVGEFWTFQRFRISDFPPILLTIILKRDGFPRQAAASNSQADKNLEDKWLTPAGGESATSTIRSNLSFAPEAGPRGFGIVRWLKQLHIPGIVAAPRLIPFAPRFSSHSVV